MCQVAYYSKKVFILKSLRNFFVEKVTSPTKHFFPTNLQGLKAIGEKRRKRKSTANFHFSLLQAKIRFMASEKKRKSNRFDRIFHQSTLRLKFLCGNYQLI